MESGAADARRDRHDRGLPRVRFGDDSSSSAGTGDAGSAGDATTAGDATSADAGDAASAAPARPCPQCNSGHCTGGKCDPLVFVTKTAMNGNLGGVGGAATLCSAAARAAGFVRPQFFLPFLGLQGMTGTVLPAFDRPYWRVDGVQIISSGAKLAVGPLDEPIARDEEGGLAEPIVWTNARADGIAAGYGCNNWQDGTTLNWGSLGSTNTRGPEWAAHAATDSCTRLHPIYCFEQVDP